MKILTILILLTGCYDGIYSQCWVNISTSSNSTFLIDEDQKLFASGSNALWQLGIGSSLFSTDTLIEIEPGSKWIEVSGGNFHTLAIKEDGSLWAWGNNKYGQLGNGNTQSQPRPVQVGTATDWLKVNTGYYSTVALKQNGSLWAWGQNNLYQLGLGNAVDKLVPTQIGNDEDWLSFSTGNVHTLAIKVNGTLWAWGNNFNGQLGDGTKEESIAPKMISLDKDWCEISSEGLHTIALKKDGTLWTWGNNTRGQLGVDSTITFIPTPIQVGVDNNWKKISTSESNSAGINANGTLWLWGSNEFGQLGFINNKPQASPIKFNNDDDWQSVSMGLFHIIGIKTNSSTLAWGRNDIGQLGIGTTMDSVLPLQIPCDITTGSSIISHKAMLDVYPNPFIDDISILSEYQQELNLYNLQGILIRTIYLIEGENTYTLNDLPIGNYILKDNQGITLQIIKVDY